MKRIEVAVGVVRNGHNVLVGQRLVKDLYFEKWEFPGGKLESGESAETALKRELLEELNINVVKATPLILLEHDYPDRQVRLHVYEVTHYEGNPIGKEGQQIKWVLPLECSKLDFLAANEPIVNSIVLPKVVLITDFDNYSFASALNVIKQYKSLEQPIMVQVREPNASQKELAEYLVRIRSVSAINTIVILNGDPIVAEKLGYDGVQLNKHRVKKYQNRSELSNQWVGISCHNEEEIEHANIVGDFSLVSPVLKTKSHLDSLSLTWDGFKQLNSRATLPCYALGGVSIDNVVTAREFGGQGIAGISSFYEK